jgi:hypothetical protein
MFCPKPLSILISIIKVFQAFKRNKPPIVFRNDMIIFSVAIKSFLNIILYLFIRMSTFKIVAHITYLKRYPFQLFILRCFHLNISELKIIILLLFVEHNLSKHTFASLLLRVIKLTNSK